MKVHAASRPPALQSGFGVLDEATALVSMLEQWHAEALRSRPGG